MDPEVVVAGAGPAGIATAVGLVRRDPSFARRVICFDRAHFPRPKPCGGGLTGRARQALDALGLAIRVPRVASGSGRLVYGGLSRDVPLGQAVDIVRREDLDADLVAQARALGVRVMEGEGVADFTVDEAAAAVSVRTTRGQALRARVLVGADGAGSRVRRAVRAGTAGELLQPLRLFRLEIPAPPELGDRMIYDFTPMADGLRGYVWLFPVPGGRANVGVMHYPSRHLPGASIDRLLRRTLTRHRVTLPGPARGWPAWPYQPDARLSAPHLVCVGDAAGIDALTGEGIAVAFEQGIVAAAAIERGLAVGDLRFDGYGRAVRHATVGRELALDRWLASLLYAPGRGWAGWLGLAMLDDRMSSLYAARVCGQAVLADCKADLVAALARHALSHRKRTRRIEAAA